MKFKCDALDIKDNTDAIRTLRTNYESIGIDTDSITFSYPILDALGRLRETTIVTEAGLYDLIAQSRKPNVFKLSQRLRKEGHPPG